MAKTNNGKASEAAVQAAFKSLSMPVLDWQRMYDASSARNAFMAQTGDFQFFLPDRHGVIEVKSTQHEHLLRSSAFSDGQRVKLYRRMIAGGRVWVIVHHWTTNVWRCIPYSDCRRAFDIEKAASVDCRAYPEMVSAVDAVIFAIENSLK